MPTEVFDLPLHPLAVHLPVVAVPVLALVTIAYVTVTRFRAATGWLLVLGVPAAVAAVIVARASGQRLATQRLADMDGQFAVDTAADITHHSQFGDALLWLTLAWTVLSWLFVALTGRRVPAPLTAWAAADAGVGRWSRLGLGVGLVAVAVTAAWFVVRAGHTGASMTWGM